MLSFLRFELRRLFSEKKNLIFLGFISLFSAYFVWSGLNEYRQFQAEKKIFIKFEKEKINQIVTYVQYGSFGFRLLYETSPLNLFFVNSSVLQDVESNIDSLEAIKVESSFKGKKLFLKRGYFKDFAGIPFIFGSLFMLYLGHLALVSPAYLRFMSGRMTLKKYYVLTTAARIFWLDLFFYLTRAGLVFSSPTRGSDFFRLRKDDFFFVSVVPCAVARLHLSVGPIDFGAGLFSQDFFPLVLHRLVHLHFSAARDQPYQRLQQISGP